MIQFRAPSHYIVFFFFFNDTAPTEIYTLSLHDALPISRPGVLEDGHQRLFDFHPRFRGHIIGDAFPRVQNDERIVHRRQKAMKTRDDVDGRPDRKSTRLNSSHSQISYAVFCLKKKTTST